MGSSMYKCLNCGQRVGTNVPPPYYGCTSGSRDPGVTQHNWVEINPNNNNPLKCRLCGSNGPYDSSCPASSDKRHKWM